MKVKRTNIVIKPDSGRVLLRPLNLGTERIPRVIGRILAMPEEEIVQQLAQVTAAFATRHQKLEPFLQQRFDQLAPHLPPDQKLSEARQRLLGAYFTMEYSLEAAALFNPSMVWHPDQSGIPADSRRFILALRATGEGHISSITFRSGTIDAQQNIIMDEPTRFVTAPEKIMPDPHTLTSANYEIIYTPAQPLSERIIFPVAPAESNGIEDVRFVEFQEDDDRVIYYGLYTAYDGRAILPQLIETADFLHFKISTLHGSAIQNKGMALFPRLINGRYAIISRQDNENIFLMFSEDLHSWNSKQLLLEPTYPWELLQLGNCGSPIETKAGWLLLTHGVGPLRQYAIGAVLLDRDEPSRVIGRSREPFLIPHETEREGYVPNVVYSCGGLIHGRELIIPYAMSDYASSFALINVDELLESF